MTPLLEGLPAKAKEAPSCHEVRLALLDTNPVFQSLTPIDSEKGGTLFFHFFRFKLQNDLKICKAIIKKDKQNYVVVCIYKYPKMLTHEFNEMLTSKLYKKRAIDTKKSNNFEKSSETFGGLGLNPRSFLM